jgi:hypothetical protein
VRKATEPHGQAGKCRPFGGRACNEQTKLSVNALDRASTVVGIGGVFPLINVAGPPNGQVDTKQSACLPEAS